MGRIQSAAMKERGADGEGEATMGEPFVADRCCTGDRCFEGVGLAGLYESRSQQVGGRSASSNSRLARFEICSIRNE